MLDEEPNTDGRLPVVEEGDHPPIYHIPGEHNRYNYPFDKIILDSRLAEHPEVYEVIREHEIEHAEHRSVASYLIHELKSDIWFYFSTDETAKKVRSYYRGEKSDPPREHPTHRSIGYGMVQMLRWFWTMAMDPLGRLYRGLISDA